MVKTDPAATTTIAPYDMKRSTIVYSIVCIGLVIANAYLYHSISTPRYTEVSVLTAGKGAATLIRTQRGNTLLIDTSSDVSILRALGMSLPFWQHSIDTIILSGTTAAEHGGLGYIRTRYRSPEALIFGTSDIPYGTTITFDEISVIINAPGSFYLSSLSDSLIISSSTPKGAYLLDKQE